MPVSQERPFDPFDPDLAGHNPSQEARLHFPELAGPNRPYMTTGVEGEHKNSQQHPIRCGLTLQLALRPTTVTLLQVSRPSTGLLVLTRAQCHPDTCPRTPTAFGPSGTASGSQEYEWIGGLAPHIVRRS